MKHGSIDNERDFDRVVDALMINIHVFTFSKVGNARREKAKTESNVDDTVEPADAYQAQRPRLTLEVTYEKKLWTFGKETGKGKGKDTGKFLDRPSCFPLEDRRQRLRELKATIECVACGRKGHWAHDRECAMSPSS